MHAQLSVSAPAKGFPDLSNPGDGQTALRPEGLLQRSPPGKSRSHPRVSRWMPPAPLCAHGNGAAVGFAPRQRAELLPARPERGAERTPRCTSAELAVRSVRLSGEGSRPRIIRAAPKPDVETPPPPLPRARTPRCAGDGDPSPCGDDELSYSHPTRRGQHPDVCFFPRRNDPSRCFSCPRAENSAQDLASFGSRRPSRLLRLSGVKTSQFREGTRGDIPETLSIAILVCLDGGKSILDVDF